MGKSYHYIPAMQQPDPTACWSTTMSWWTKAVPAVKNHTELEIMGMYQHLAGGDDGLKFPDGFKTMLEDKPWGMVTDRLSGLFMDNDLYNAAFKKGPAVAGFWDISVGGYHAVALYNPDIKNKEVWVMDPNGATHTNRDMFDFVLGNLSKPGVIGYRK